MSVSLHLRARVCGQDERYRPLAETGLHGAFAQTGGAGTLADPALYTVTLRNESGAPWQGVVLAELAFPHKEPRFFLPGFLYGRNRGERRSASCKEIDKMTAGSGHTYAA